MEKVCSSVTTNIISAVLLFTLTAQAQFDETKYWEERNSLIEEEKSLSFGGGILFQSENEKRANDLLMTHKQFEIDEAFMNQSEFLPSENFLRIINDIEQSNVFKIIKKMPKGAVLHVHGSALVSSEWIYENVTFRDNIYICMSSKKILLHVFKVPTNDCDWQLLSDLRRNETIGKEINLLLRRELTFVTENPTKAYPDNDSRWKKFKKIFDITVPLLRYKPLFEDYLYQGLEELYEDNVMFVEIRTPLAEMYDFDGKKYNEDDTMKVFTDVSNRFIKDHPNFIGIRVIYSKYRKASASQLENFVKKAIELKEKYPDLLAGVDLIGREDGGYPLRNWIRILKPLVNKVNFYFHAGETNWYGLESDENLFDAVLLNATRISHGFALTKHPKILELMRLKQIPTVICPISNQVLGLVEDLRNHPANVLFSQNFPIVISNDDPGAWGARALSYDFYQAFMGLMSKRADIRALKQLAINSIHYSSMDADTKARANEIWRREWNKFINNLITDPHI